MSRRPARGSGTVEYALCVSLFFFIVLVSWQIAMIVTQYYGTLHVARETARWVAIRPNTVDSDIVAYAYSHNLPWVSTSGDIAVTVTPSCMVLQSGRCPSRVSGEIISVRVDPELSRVVFLPSTFGLGELQVTLPTDLTAARVSMMIE